MNEKSDGQFQLNFSPPAPNALQVGGQSVPLLFVRRLRARRYLLRLQPDGVARVTVPRGGTIAEAGNFAARNTKWLEKQLKRLAAEPVIPAVWKVGTKIWFRGELVAIAPDADGSISFGDEKLKVADATTDLKPAIQNYLRRLAAAELSLRTLELAGEHGLFITGVTVRNQKRRWGSCSHHGRISLNWRLIQAPVFVRDYIILHELAHRRQMNHSKKFWQEVGRLSPNYRQAEQWIKQHGKLLR
jgi:predicted metal-dependent hydrolase